MYSLKLSKIKPQNREKVLKEKQKEEKRNIRRKEE
jgi:hypothetical protein